MAERRCGGCTACCAVVPVADIGLHAFTRCPMLLSPPDAGVGCSIYPDRPRSCALWNCQWYAEPDWSDELRPDRCGVVVDIVPDLVNIDGRDLPAMQCWVLPGREDAYHADPLVRNLVLSIIAAGFAVIWRTRDPDRPGDQLGRVLWREPSNGQLHQSDLRWPDAEGKLDDHRSRVHRALDLMESGNA